MNEDKEQNGGEGAERIMERPSGWAMGLASIMCSVMNFYILYLYGIVHWNLMIDFRLKYNLELPAEARQVIYSLLGDLWLGRGVLSTLALAWAIWAFRGRPRWLAYVALMLALFSMSSLLIIM